MSRLTQWPSWMIRTEYKDKSFSCLWLFPPSRLFLGTLLWNKQHPWLVSHLFRASCYLTMQISSPVGLQVLDPRATWPGSAQHIPLISVQINLWTPVTHYRSAIVLALWSRGLGTRGHFHHLPWVSAAIDRPLSLSQRRFVVLLEVVQTSIITTWGVAECNCPIQCLSSF